MTVTVLKTIRFRSAYVVPSGNVTAGTASAAASDTAPRKPAQPSAVRTRQFTRRVRCTARRSTTGLPMPTGAPGQPGEDRNGAGRERDQQRVPYGAGVDAAHRVRHLHPDEHEQASVDQECRQVPKRERPEPRPGPDHPRASVRQHQTGHHDGDHAAGVDDLGEQPSSCWPRRRNLQPGVINLGHANHPPVLSCFDQLVALIHSRNLTPVTLDEMFGTSRATG